MIYGFNLDYFKFDNHTTGRCAFRKCGHSYCENCMKELVRTSRTCPACRESVTEADILRIF